MALPEHAGLRTFHQIVADLVAKQHDLSLRQILVLLECHATPGAGGRTIRGLAEACHVAKPVVTRAVDRLEECEYAERRDDPDDRRSVLVVLTRKGREFAKALN